MPETKKNPADKPQQKQPGRGSDQNKPGSQKQPGQSGNRDKDDRR